MPPKKKQTKSATKATVTVKQIVDGLEFAERWIANATLALGKLDQGLPMRVRFTEGGIQARIFPGNGQLFEGYCRPDGPEGKDPENERVVTVAQVVALLEFQNWWIGMSRQALRALPPRRGMPVPRVKRGRWTQAYPHVLFLGICHREPKIKDETE